MTQVTASDYRSDVPDPDDPPVEFEPEPPLWRFPFVLVPLALPELSELPPADPLWEPLPMDPDELPPDPD